jgi:hypothetical protein
VPPLGIRGAGLATVASSAWFFALTMAFSQRHYSVAHDWMRLGAALALSIAVLLLGQTVIPTGRAHALAPWPLVEKTILSCLGSVMIARLLVRRDELMLVWGWLRRPLLRAQGSVS